MTAYIKNDQVKLQHQDLIPSSLDFDLVFAWLGRKGILIKVVKIRVKQSFLSRDPLAGIIHEHCLQQIKPAGLQLFHAVLKVHGGPVGEGCLNISKLNFLVLVAVTMC